MSQRCCFLMRDRGDGMAILLTNGKYFITHNKTGAVIKVTNISKAQNFYTMERALEQITKTPGKCKSYYPVDTSVTEIEPDINVGNKKKVKRKQYSENQRKIIYQRADGRCQLCGRKIEFNNMTVDHIIPISKGGSNDMDNTEATCFPCNQFKSNIFPAEFVDRITEIFLFQMEKKHSNRLKWKIAHKLLMEML